MMAATYRRRRRKRRVVEKPHKLPRNWNKATASVLRRISHLAAENAHQHHLVDQAERYLDHLVAASFPLPNPSELDYLSAPIPFASHHEAGEFAQEKVFQ